MAQNKPQANQQANQQKQGWNPLQFQQMLQAIMQRQNMMAQPRMNPLAQYWLNAGVPGVGVAQNMIAGANASIQSGLNRLNNSVFFDPNNPPASKLDKVLALLSKILGGDGGLGALGEIAGDKGAVSKSGNIGHGSKGSVVHTKENIRKPEMAVRSITGLRGAKNARKIAGNNQFGNQLQGAVGALDQGFQNVEAPKMRKQAFDLDNQAKQLQHQQMVGNINQQVQRQGLVSDATKRAREARRGYADLLGSITKMLG